MHENPGRKMSAPYFLNSSVILVTNIGGRRVQNEAGPSCPFTPPRFVAMSGVVSSGFEIRDLYFLLGTSQKLRLQPQTLYVRWPKIYKSLVDRSLKDKDSLEGQSASSWWTTLLRPCSSTVAFVKQQDDNASFQIFAGWKRCGQCGCIPT